MTGRDTSQQTVLDTSRRAGANHFYYIQQALASAARLMAPMMLSLLSK
jgi:hypothetical protein